MKYLIVKRGYEYNDEYNVFNEDGYTIESKLYNTKEEAKTLGMKDVILNEFKDWKGNFNSANFDFKQFDYGEGSERLEEYFKKKKYKFDEDDYQLFLPKNLSEDEVLEAWKYFDVKLFEIKEIEEN